ncbi:hypothetical protein ACWCPM_07960 [Streptomyces sp. NPDC002309]
MNDTSRSTHSACVRTPGGSLINHSITSLTGDVPICEHPITTQGGDETLVITPPGNPRERGITSGACIEHGTEGAVGMTSARTQRGRAAALLSRHA